MSHQWNNLKTNEDIQIMYEANVISRNLIISSIILNWSFCTICGIVQVLFDLFLNLLFNFLYYFSY